MFISFVALVIWKKIRRSLHNFISWCREQNRNRTHIIFQLYASNFAPSFVHFETISFEKKKNKRKKFHLCKRKEFFLPYSGIPVGSNKSILLYELLMKIPYLIHIQPISSYGDNSRNSSAVTSSFLCGALQFASKYISINNFNMIGWVITLSFTCHTHLNDTISLYTNVILDRLVANNGNAKVKVRSAHEIMMKIYAYYNSKLMKC